MNTNTHTEPNRTEPNRTEPNQTKPNNVFLCVFPHVVIHDSHMGCGWEKVGNHCVLIDYISRKRKIMTLSSVVKLTCIKTLTYFRISSVYLECI